MKNFLQRLGKLSLQQRALFESRLLQMRSRGDAAVSGVSGGSESCPQRREKQVRCAAPRNPYMHFEPEEVEQSIAARFEQQARRWANRVAVKTAHHELTYAALNRAANQLAHFLLQERGNGAEPVGLLIEHGAPMVIALLAVLKAGKFYVPLDPAFPRERLAYILDDAQVGIVLTSDALIGTASELAGPHRRILSVDAVASAYSIDNPELPTAPEAFAYLLYTSGSMGEAKGVVENHRNVLHFTMVRTNSTHIAADDRLAMLLSFSFSGSATPLYCALLNGAALHLRYLKETGAADLARWLAAEQITVCITSVSAFRQLVSTLNGSEQFPRLRLLRVGAEPVYRRDVELFRKYFPASCLLLNSIGSTEMKNFAEYFIDHDTVIEDDLVPVGYPVEDTEILLLDDDGQAVGLGEIGEIVVKTRFIAPSYWRRPELTQTTFQPAPGGGDERLYRTGDLGRQRPDGALVHLGRKDFQVKIRGYRIEIGEIENALLALPDVSAAVVVAREDEPGDRRLVAYVVLSRGAGPRIGAWRAALAAKLPDYMIPASFVILESLPLTSTGKVDRAKLPQPDRDRPVLETPYTEPDSQLEKVLATLWAEVLGLHRVGMNDDFSILGGDSLRGVRLLTNVKAVFGVDLPFERLLKDAATLAGMARAIEEVRSRATPDKGPTYGSHGTRPTSIPHRQESKAAHLSDTQRRMWFHASLNPDDATYNESRAYRLIGDVNVEALDRSVRYMARRHEILRTTYSLVDDEPRQIVHEDLAIELKRAELGAVPKKQRSQAVERLLLGEMQRAFDLEAGAPLRILLLRLSEREAVLLRVIHHIASDGWSSGIIEREISAAYNAFVKGREPQLPALPIQYADYATWQREWLQGEALEGQLAYWKAQLANLPTLELPTDRPRPPMLSYRGTRAAFDLPASLMQGLKTLGQREGATLFMTLLAAFHVLLSRYSGQEDVAVGTPIAGRGRIKLERLIGFFANTLVLRSDLSGNPRFRELLARVRETALGAYTHQDLPFEKLVEELDPARDMSRNPLFQVMFALQNAPAATLALEGVEVSRLPLKGNTARFDLTLSVHESADGLHASWEYATDLFDAATIQRLGGHFNTLLEAIVVDPEQRIGELPLLTEAECHQLLVQWNDTAADYPRDRCIHQLFEAQAARTPERTALRVGTTVLSYAELDTLATRIAQALRAQGVGRGQRVGLCVERGADMLAAMLGILKAGAAYVPLDPAFPQERLRFMARDAELTLLLSTAALAEPFGLPRERQLLLDTDAAALASHSDQRLTPDAALDAHPEDPAASRTGSRQPL